MSDLVNDPWSPSPRYIFYRKIAEGGTAIVTLAWDTVDEEWRAIKTLQRDYAKRTALRNRFEREGKTMTTLDHPNVIRVYDAVADDETAYLVMEYAEGGSIIDWLEQNGAMPPRMATEVALQLCRGIEAAHVQGIIHRDIKPQNLVIDRNGLVKVTDFGIAQATKEPRLTLTGTVMGTVGYMAPEQSESAKHADERADIYSIAATLYTLVRGQAPTHLFMAEDEDYYGIPPRLAAVIQRGGEYRREARYGSVTEMADALEEVLAELPRDPPTTPPLLAPNLELVDQMAPPSENWSAPDYPAAEGHGTIPAAPRAEELAPAVAERRRADAHESSLLPYESPRPVIRIPRRDPVHDQVRRARLVTVGAIIAFLVVMFYGALGFVGQLQVNSAQTKIELAEQDLVDSILDHSTLPERLSKVSASNADLVTSLFARISVETDRNRRDGDIARLVGVLDLTLRELQGSGGINREGALRATESALKSILDRQIRYAEFAQSCRALEDTLVARVARTLPTLQGRCLSETLQ